MATVALSHAQPETHIHHCNSTVWKPGNVAVLVTALVIAILTICIGTLALLSSQGVPIGAFNSLGSLGSSGSWSLIGFGSFIAILDLVSFAFLAKNNRDFMHKCTDEKLTKKIKDVTVKLEPNEMVYFNSPVCSLITKQLNEKNEPIAHVRYYDSEENAKKDIEKLNLLKGGFKQKDPAEYSSSLLPYFKEKVEGVFLKAVLDSNKYLEIDLCYGTYPCYIVATLSTDDSRAGVVPFANQKIHLATFQSKKSALKAVADLKLLKFEPHDHSNELKKITEDLDDIKARVNPGTYTIIYSINFTLFYGKRVKDSSEITVLCPTTERIKKVCGLHNLILRDPFQHEHEVIRDVLKPHVKRMCDKLFPGQDSNRKYVGIEFKNFKPPFFYFQEGNNVHFLKEEVEFQKRLFIWKARGRTAYADYEFFIAFHSHIPKLQVPPNHFQVLQYTHSHKTMQCCYIVSQEGVGKCVYSEKTGETDISDDLEEIVALEKHSDIIDLNRIDSKKEA